MFSHVTLGTNDLQRARPFWIAVMKVLGHPVMFEREGGIAFGQPAGLKTFIGPTFDSGAAAPSLRPHYHPNYYGAYARDPDGNKLRAVCHSVQR